MWAEIQNLGVPLSFHEGGRVNLPQPGDNFTTHMLYHTCTHPMGMMLAAVDIVGGGRAGALPGADGGVPGGELLVGTLAAVAAGRALRDVRVIRPSRPEDGTQRVLPRQCYLSVECDEEPAEIVSRYGLEDNVVFSTDYPHADSKYPKSVDRFMELPLSDDAKRSSCGTTAHGCTGLRYSRFRIGCLPDSLPHPEDSEAL
ncbi:hypothetical protein GBAR_LOCUS29953 [Geodia barretti]|uniref:Amidohydrolase-related domain-containing protein n=1 Tax=Geodia barretti TaxID=519541 RepID=A0AA35TXM4_GEOBA|nr:hypothetical protein GBAR_LOCUS29953 [Geodia barretti]